MSPQGIHFQVNLCQNPFTSALHFISESGLRQPDPALGSSSHRGVAALHELDPNTQDNYKTYHTESTEMKLISSIWSSARALEGKCAGLCIVTANAPNISLEDQPLS